MKHLTLCLSLFISTMLLISCQKEEKAAENIINGSKQTLILARSAENDFSSDTADRLIAGFNNISNEYYIQEQLYETSDNLSIDIYAGKTIDLLYIGDWIDMSPMVNKELLCDLYSFIDNDTEISRNDFVEPVLTALETNGKLYLMPYDFSVESAIVKAKLWDNSGDMSFEHIIEVAEENGCKIPFDFSLESYSFIPYISSQYINYSTGECSFNDGRFEEFLEFIKQYVNIIADTDREDIYEMFINDEMLLMDCGFSSFEQIDYVESDVGDKIKFVGFPSEVENYHIAVPETSFAIFSQSENQIGAFEFIKFGTSYNAYIDESGALLGGYCLSINKKVLERCAEKSAEINSYKLDEKQKQWNNNEIMRQINSVNGSGMRTGDIVAAVLSEELQLYFKGDKSSAEVCEVIQNRISTYFNEQK